MRPFLVLILSLLYYNGASAQTAGPVQVELSLARGKTAFRMGEPILLDLAFTATEPGYSLNSATTEPASPVDALVLSPSEGVFPWLEDQARGNRYSPDYAGIASLEVGKPQTVALFLNSVYRFDAPGHYKVHAVTNRVGVGDMRNRQPLGALTSNEVEFDVQAISDAEEAARAASLERQIRQASDRWQAQSLAEELDWVTGDASTRAKLSLFLHPKTFYPFAIDVSRGLWVARNRALVVAELERALSDPAQPLSPSSQLLSTAVALKARLEAPYDPAAPGRPLPTQQIESQYLKRIAATLPQRTGEPLVTAALTLLIQLAQRKETAGPDFSAAREVLVTHFADVNEYSVDWLLNTYGSYLQDMRIVPALENILQTQTKPILVGERTAAFSQLIRLAPEDVRPFVIKELCSSPSVKLDAIRSAPFVTLPETDACLKEQIHAAAENAPGEKRDLQQKTSFAARFATNAIYDDLLALYEKSSGNWDGQSRGGLLAYFVRWDAKRALPLLQAALPLNAEQFDSNITFALFKAYYSDGLEVFLRERLAVGLPGQAAFAAFQLSQHGPAEDQDILRQRLDRWRAQWLGKDIPHADGKLELELVLAVIRGKQWQMPEPEADSLRVSCISMECRSRFKTNQ